MKMLSSFRQSLFKKINRCPKAIRFHSFEGQTVANIAEKARRHLKENPPKGKAVFDTMFRPVF